MSPGHIFDLVAILCFVLAMIPTGAPINVMALGLIFFVLGHWFA